MSNGEKAAKTEHQGWSQAGVLGVGLVIASGSILADPILVRFVWPGIREFMSINVSVSLGLLNLSGLTFTPAFSMVLPLVLWGLFLLPWRRPRDSRVWREFFDCLARTVTFLVLLFVVAVVGEALGVMLEAALPEMEELNVAARVSLSINSPLSEIPGEMTIRFLGLVGMLTVAGGYVRRVVLRPVGRYLARAWPQRRAHREADKESERTAVRMPVDSRPRES
ncbi:MAG: hypothetical protein JSU73_05930 [candidate division WOR-3 bacterium]|nr:MAG: hypothetical protein JSU73_05930 [candidate division WOR-3 bacterium]